MVANKMAADEGLQIGRRRKAKRIAEAIRSLSGTVADARKLSDDEWLEADMVSRMKNCPICEGLCGMICGTCNGKGRVLGSIPDKPPSQATRALVIEELSRPEAPEFEQCPPRDEDVPA